MYGDLGTELSNLAAAPETGLVPVLERALGRLAVASGADAAALLIFDPAELQIRFVAAAAWGRTATPPELFFRRASEDPGGRLADTCRGGRPHAIQDHGQPAEGPALSADRRSSLWLPLAENRRATGLLVLEAGRPGAFAPARVEGLEKAARQALPALQRALLRHWLRQVGAPVSLVGQSAAFLELESQLRQAGAVAGGAVLITGERGSGKELAAWAIHAWSARRNRPFVPLLAAACADSMTSDELFGHERHSFTGAASQRPGKLQAADGGTLLLDEAGDLPAATQAALLRVLEQGEVQRIGRDEPLRVNVRVIAATNHDMGALQAAGQFRRDLYDRLSLFEIRVPPLRDRPEDIPLLARHFMRATCSQTWRFPALEREGVCRECGDVKPSGCATPDFFAVLRAYAWPGNVRELRQTIGRLVATVTDDVLDVHHLPERVRAAYSPAAPPDSGWTLDTAMRRHIEKALQHTAANQSEAARLLGLPLSTLRSKMKKLGIDAPRPR